MLNSKLYNCLKLLLKPFIRFCLRHSIKLQDIHELIKYNLVVLAKEELVKTSSSVNVSRLALITGVHRPDIVRIESEGVKQNDSDQITKIIGQWQSDKRFTTPAGRARTLSVVGKESEFAELVRTVNKELNPYTLLFELERIEAVQRTNKGLKLVAKGFDPSKDAEAGFELLAKDVDDLLLAVEENILNTDQAPNHHIKTEYDRIPAEYNEQIKAWIQLEGAKFHKRLREYLSKLDKDINPDVACKQDNGYIRVAVGSVCTVTKKDTNEENN